MKICYYEKNPSIPVLLVDLTADWAHIDVAFPISIGLSVYPFRSVVTLSHSATGKNVFPCCTPIQEISSQAHMERR